MNLKEKIKQHWKVILLCLVTFFWMSACTKSCSKGSEIKKLTRQIEVLDSTNCVKDSIIMEYRFQKDHLSGLLEMSDKHSSNFTSIAGENQLVLLEKISDLEKNNKKLTEEKKRLEHLVNGLTKENEILRSQLDTIIRK